MESSAPAKPQPLHNFDLPNLKWNTDGNSSSSHHHRRRSIKSPSRRPNVLSASPIRQSPSRDSVSAPPPPPFRCLPSPRESPIRGESPKPSPTRECHSKHSLTGGGPERLLSIRDESQRQFWSGHSSPETEALRKSKCTPIVYRGNHSRNSASSGSIRICSSGTEKAKDKIEEKSRVPEEGDEAGIKRSKILIKIPRINNTKPEGEKYPQDEPTKIGDNDGGLTDEIVNSVNEEMRIWNLRPRKPTRKSKNIFVDPEKTEKPQPPLKNTNKSGEKEPKKKKLSICISLSKEEIEEDIYAFSGSKPSRRPKKRAKNVQKTVDSVFPGLWLVSISPDSYKVSENSMKG